MQLRGTAIVVDTVSAKRPFISISDTARVLNTTESGSTVMFDRLAGNTLTLPDNAVPGTNYEVVILRAPTSNSHKIITGLNGSTNAVLVGAVTAGRVSSGLTTTLQCAEGATTNRFASVVLNGDTQGGHPGTRLYFHALSAGTWYVSGLMVGTGVQQSPFSTATT